MVYRSTHFFWLGLILLGIVSLIYIFSFGLNDHSPSLPKIPGKVKIAAYAGETTSLIWLSKELGFLEQAGLDVELKPFAAGIFAVNALTNNEADIAVAAEFVLANKSFSEPELRILSSIVSAKTIFVVGHKSRNIESPSDLKGKRIGVTLGSNAEFFLGQFLTLYGLQFNDINIVDLKPPQLVKSMLDGSIDAAITWHPNVYVIEQQLGEKVIKFDAQKMQDYFFVLLAKSGWLQSHPTHTERLMQALIWTEDWIKKHPDETKKTIEKIFKGDPKYIAMMVDLHSYQVKFSQNLMVALDAQKRWLIKNKGFDAAQQPNLLNFIYPSALKKIKPSAVTVIK